MKSTAPEASPRARRCPIRELPGLPALRASRLDAEDRVLRRDRLELLDRSRVVDRDVRTRSDGSFEVRLDHGRATIRRHLEQAHLASPAVPDDGPPAGGPHVADPGRPLAEHRDNVPLSLVFAEHDRNGGDTAAPVARRLERDQRGWPQAQPAGERPRSPRRAPGEVWPTVPVEEPVAVPVGGTSEVERIRARQPEDAEQKDAGGL